MGNIETGRISPRIMFLCNFSNAMVREKIKLGGGIVRSLFYRLIRKKPHYETDYAIWVTDYIEEFEKHPEYDFHVVAPMQGLKDEFQMFEVRGIKYHFYNCSFGLMKSIANVAVNWEERRDYPIIRQRISKIRKQINPDMMILCGAENPFYSIGALDVTECPVYVILQTLLNCPKRIEMGIGTPYKRKIELEIFRHAQYFSTSEEESIKIIKKTNYNARILSAGFPSHRPVVVEPKEKEYDFVLFAKTVAKYKGVEDALKALSIVKEKYSEVSLNIIGGITDEYQNELARIIDELGLKENVNFAGQYKELKETFENVVKAKACLLPGLTGAFNSTIRESMLIGMPTICYQLSATDIINKEEKCLFAATMGDVSELSKMMLLVFEQPEVVKRVADNGKKYADSHFGNEVIVNKLLNNCNNIIKGAIVDDEYK